MSHVDDGELTAYADGAYPVNDPDALRISAHLSACDNCRTRLEQAHALRDRAAEILGFATPAVRTAPAFEALEAQIATSSARPRRHFNYAWAASIMLAVGLGWFGRGAWQNPPEMRESASPMQATAPAQDLASEEVGVTPPAAVPAPAPQVSTQTQEAERPEARARQLDAMADLGKREAKVGAVAGNTAVAAAPPPPAAPVMAEADFAGEGASTPQYISAADAERRNVVYPRIPELPVARIGVGQGTTIVEQTLPDGKVIRLTVNENVAAEPERREQASAARTRAAPEMAQVQKTRVPEVTVSRNNKLITITGDVPADSLRALAQKIK
jgi:hypothetical protein